MTTKAQWLALAERCEKATGPDRELDCAIYALAKKHMNPAALLESFRREFSISAMIDAYTTSLDAITALIERELPAAWVWTLGQNIHHRTWSVSINNLDSDGAPYSVCWGASSYAPALALCAAFCRAMACKSEVAG
jgi:hypothetical protein